MACRGSRGSFKSWRASPVARIRPRDGSIHISRSPFNLAFRYMSDIRMPYCSIVYTTVWKVKLHQFSSLDASNEHLILKCLLLSILLIVATVTPILVSSCHLHHLLKPGLRQLQSEHTSRQRQQFGSYRPISCGAKRYLLF
jgi:hypothetical protein